MSDNYESYVFLFILNLRHFKIVSYRKDDIEADLMLLSQAKKDGICPNIVMCRCIIGNLIGFSNFLVLYYFLSIKPIVFYISFDIVDSYIYIYICVCVCVNMSLNEIQMATVMYLRNKTKFLLSISIVCIDSF